MVLSKELLSGLLIPFIGTAAGAACFFFLKKTGLRAVMNIVL